MQKEENKAYVFKGLNDLSKLQPSKEVLNNKYINESVK